MGYDRDIIISDILPKCRPLSIRLAKAESTLLSPHLKPTWRPRRIGIDFPEYANAEGPGLEPPPSNVHGQSGGLFHLVAKGVGGRSAPQS